MSPKTLLRVSVCAGLTGGVISAQAASGHPNVLFILADDLGYGGLHCYGNDYVETPNIDNLYSQGLHFTDGLAAFPTCRPSRASLLTGQYGPRTGVYRVCDSYGDEDKARWVIPENLQLDPAKVTLGKAFKQAGYTTAMYGKWHVSNENVTHPKDYFGFDEAYVSHGAHFNAESLPEVDLPQGKMIEEVYTGMAEEFMEKAVKEQKPFFIYMPYFLVHAPFEAYPADVAHFREKLKGRTDIIPPSKFSKTSKHGHDLETVLAMTKQLDRCVGDLLTKLDKLGIADDTIVIFTSDNGSYDRNLTGGFRGRKGDTYEGGLRVPYIFRWPGRIKPGTSSDERITGVDVYPTLLSLAGIPLPPAEKHPVDGESLAPLLLGKQTRLPKRKLYCFYPKYNGYRNGRWRMSWRNVIYNNNFKLIEYPEYGEYELFDLADDRKESNNLAENMPEKLAQMTEELHGWIKDIDAPKLVPNPDYNPQDSQPGEKKRRGKKRRGKKNKKK